MASFDCGVCGDDVFVHDAIHTKCGHVYHAKCMEVLINKSNGNVLCYECVEDISNEQEPRLLCGYCNKAYNKLDVFTQACNHTL